MALAYRDGGPKVHGAPGDEFVRARNRLVGALKASVIRKLLAQAPHLLVSM